MHNKSKVRWPSAHLHRVNFIRIGNRPRALPFLMIVQVNSELQQLRALIARSLPPQRLRSHRSCTLLYCLPLACALTRHRCCLSGNTCTTRRKLCNLAFQPRVCQIMCNLNAALTRRIVYLVLTAIARIIFSFFIGLNTHAVCRSPRTLHADDVSRGRRTLIHGRYHQEVKCVCRRQSPKGLRDLRSRYSRF